MFGALVGEEKVFVEAEKAPGGVVLSLRDVRLRRKLLERAGRHNATMGITELRALGFPDQFFADLQRGRPVQFKMNYSAFADLVGGRSRLDGLSQTDWACEDCEGEVIPQGALQRGGTQQGRCLQCGRVQAINVEAAETDPPVFSHDPFAPEDLDGVQRRRR